MAENVSPYMSDLEKQILEKKSSGIELSPLEKKVADEAELRLADFEKGQRQLEALNLKNKLEAQREAAKQTEVKVTPPEPARRQLHGAARQSKEAMYGKLAEQQDVVTQALQKGAQSRAEVFQQHGLTPVEEALNAREAYTKNAINEIAEAVQPSQQAPVSAVPAQPENMGAVQAGEIAPAPTSEPVSEAAEPSAPPKSKKIAKKIKKQKAELTPEEPTSAAEYEQFPTLNVAKAAADNKAGEYVTIRDEVVKAQERFNKNPSQENRKELNKLQKELIEAKKNAESAAEKYKELKGKVKPESKPVSVEPEPSSVTSKMAEAETSAPKLASEASTQELKQAAGQLAEGNASPGILQRIKSFLTGAGESASKPSPDIMRMGPGAAFDAPKPMPPSAGSVLGEGALSLPAGSAIMRGAAKQIPLMAALETILPTPTASAYDGSQGGWSPVKGRPGMWAKGADIVDQATYEKLKAKEDKIAEFAGLAEKELESGRKTQQTLKNLDVLAGAKLRQSLPSMRFQGETDQSLKNEIESREQNLGLSEPPKDKSILPAIVGPVVGEIAKKIMEPKQEEKEPPFEEPEKPLPQGDATPPEKEDIFEKLKKLQAEKTSQEENELKEALKERNLNKFLYALTRGSEKIGGGVGGLFKGGVVTQMGDAEMAKLQREAIDEPLSDLKLKRGLAQERALRDPNSAESQTMRNIARDVIGLKIPETASYESIVKILPTLSSFEAKKAASEVKSLLVKSEQDAKKERDKDKAKEKRDKEFTKMSEKLTSEIASSRSSFGKSAGIMRSAEALETFIKGIDLKDITTRQIYEIARGLDSMLSQGAATISGTKKLIPSSYSGSLANILEYITSIPKGAGQEEFIKQMMETVSREKQLAGEQIKRTQGKLLSGYKHLKEKDPEKYEEILNEFGLSSKKERESNEDEDQIVKKLYDPKANETLHIYKSGKKEIKSGRG